MDIEMQYKNDREMNFILVDTNPQFANALRRIAISEVPVLAIESVDFYENESVFYDEIIAHRLAMIPLVFDSKAFVEPEKCKCEGKGCSDCQIVFALDKKGPCTVYSGDLKSADPKAAKPLYDNIPIVKLNEDKRLKFDAVASLGIGKNHAKFKASKAYYRMYPTVKLEGKLENPMEVEKACPKGVLKISGEKAEVGAECDLCAECMKVAKPNDMLRVTGDRTKLIFTIESISGLTAEQIFLKALDILRKKAIEFKKEVGKI